MATYFDDLPKDIIVSILCNLKIDIAVHSLIKLVGEDSSIYRRICIMLFPEMKVYPYEMIIREIRVSWEGLYRAVSIYRNIYSSFDKFKFYTREITGNSDVLLLMLYDYSVNISDQMTLFTGTLIYSKGSYVDAYYLNYFCNLINNIYDKRNKILRRLISCFKSVPLDRPDTISYKIDNEGYSIRINDRGDKKFLEITASTTKLNKEESLKRGYIPDYLTE